MADPHYDAVTLLLPMLGEAGSKTFTDFSLQNNTVSATDSGTGPAISQAQSVFYGASGAFSPTLGGLTVDVGNGAEFGLGDYTIEAWVWLSSSATHSDQGIVYSPWTQLYASSPDGVSGFRLACYNLYTSSVVEGSSINAHDQWHHVAVTRASGTQRLFVGGAIEHEVADAEDHGVFDLYVGHQGDHSYFTGYLSDVRVTKGVARYTGAFTPPGSLVKRLSGVVTGADGSAGQRTVVAVPRAYPGRVYAAESSSAAGEYSLWVPDEEVSRIVFADESVIMNDLVDRVMPG